MTKHVSKSQFLYSAGPLSRRKEPALSAGRKGGAASVRVMRAWRGGQPAGAIVTRCAMRTRGMPFGARVEAPTLHLGRAIFPGKPGRTRIGQSVEYYGETYNCTPRWALPDVIAASKLKTFSWQNEYRLVFSLTDALNFENAQYS